MYNIKLKCCYLCSSISLAELYAFQPEVVDFKTMSRKGPNIRTTYSSKQAQELIFSALETTRSSDEDQSSEDESNSDMGLQEHDTDSAGGGDSVDNRGQRDSEVGDTESAESESEEEGDDDSDMQSLVEGYNRPGLSDTTQSEPASDDDLEDYFFAARKGHEMWLKEPGTVTGRQEAQNVMKQAPGPTTYAKRRANTPREALELFITPRIATIILEMSNKEGQRVFGVDWHPATIEELSGFFGLLYLAGVYRSAGEATEELWHSTDGRKIFRAVMSLKRFKHISRVLRFDNKESRSVRCDRDKLAPIRDVFDIWVNSLSASFIPYENVTIDEQLVAFRGRCSFRQFMKSKPAKYGLKLWILCDSSTSYALNIQVYTGKVGDCPEKNQGERVVHDMVDVIKGSGRNITVDNFFTSVPLARQLLQKKLSLVGTLRKNKAEIPTEFLPAKDRPVHSSVFGHQQQLTLVSYVPKRNRAVILLSSMHRGAEISNRPDSKPEIILSYNHTKAGVDTLDQMVSTYTTKRMTRRWPMILFYNMLDISAVNAFVIWTHLNPQWNANKKQRRRLFLKKLGKSLVHDQLQSRLSIPGLSQELRLLIEQCIVDPTGDGDDSPSDRITDVSPGHGVTDRETEDAESNTSTSQLPLRHARKRGRCRACPREHDKKVRTVCDSCNKFVCDTHSAVKMLCKSCFKN
jgi:hypothetical protein